MKHLGLVLLVFLLGCQATVKEQDIEPIVQSPHGILLTFHLLPDKRFVDLHGELLAAEKGGYYIEILGIPRRLLFVPMDGIDRIEFSDGRIRDYPTSENKRKTLQDSIRYLSRFPQGMTPELLASLQAALNIETVESIEMSE